MPSSLSRCCVVLAVTFCAAPVPPCPAAAPPGLALLSPGGGDAILSHSHAGAITLDGTTHPFTEVGFEVVERDSGETSPAIIGVFAGERGYVVVPIDVEREEPEGDLILVRGETLWLASSPRVRWTPGDEDGALLAEGRLVGEGGERGPAFVLALSIGAGTSTFVLEGNTARLNGELGSGTYAQVRHLIAHHPEIDTIVFGDVPGSVNDEVNVRTGRLVRRAGYTTRLGPRSVIASGGVDLFLAGARRVVVPGAMIGVHSWGDPSGDLVPAELPRDHPAHALHVAYFRDIMDDGVEFYFYTLGAAPFDDIHWMTPDEIERWGVATE